MKKAVKRKAKRKGAQALPVSAVTVATMPPKPTPTYWDLGASGPANRIGLVDEDAADIDPTTGQRQNPNGIRRARRVDMLEVWHRKGDISTAGFNIAEKLRNAFENTQRAPGWPDSERVDSSPKPDHAVTIQIDRFAAYFKIVKHVVPYDQMIIACCVLERGTPAQMRLGGRRPYYGPSYQDGLRHLRFALDRLAHAMGC